MTAVLGLASFVALAACTFTRNLDYLQKGDRTAPPAEEQEDAATPPAKPKDSGSVVEGPDANPCPMGNRFRPVEVIQDFTAPSAGGDPQALACEVDNVLDEDGKTANLDRQSDPSFKGKATLGGVGVAGCVLVRFDDAVPLENLTVVVKLGPIGDGCGVSPCAVTDDGDGQTCGTPEGRQAFLFAGATLDTMSQLANPKYTADDLLPYVSPNKAPSGSHFVAVCRGATVSVKRDDVAVDAIWATCP